MRPGTLHSVTTMTDSISVGGHFFSAPTIKYSIYSIFHTFVGARTITNVPMDNEQQMLLRIALFWHQEMTGKNSGYLKRIATCGEGTVLILKSFTSTHFSPCPDLIAHIPNVRNFEDFQNLVMLLNYSELVLVLTPARYVNPSLFNFENVIYQLPRKRSCEMRSWLAKNFQLRLDPPVCDGFTDDTRLTAVLLQSLTGQAHMLWESVKRRAVLGVLGEFVSKGGQDRQIAPAQVLSAIREDLSGFPGFSMGADVVVKQAPPSYCFPLPPKKSRYVLEMSSL